MTKVLHSHIAVKLDSAPYTGAWVTMDAPVVPVPGALVLATTGLLSSLLGVNRHRRKRR